LRWKTSKGALSTHRQSELLQSAYKVGKLATKNQDVRKQEKTEMTSLLGRIEKYSKLTYSSHFMGLNNGMLQICSKRLPFTKEDKSKEKYVAPMPPPVLISPAKIAGHKKIKKQVESTQPTRRKQNGFDL